VSLLRYPARVTLEANGATREWDYTDGTATVHVPDVAIHRAIAIESGKTST
jgi:hypothetical protein